MAKKVKKLKLKTNKAATKRFKVTATGKVMYQPAGRRHLAMSKNAKRRRHSNKWRTLTGAHDIKKMHLIMGTGGVEHFVRPSAAEAPVTPAAKKG